MAICFLALPTGAGAESPADWMYEPTTFTEIDLELPPASYEALEDREYDDYVEAEFSIAETNGVPGQSGPFTAPITVGVALKGSKGSRRDITEKAALKVKFNEFVKGQTFLGVKKLTLNNMVQDPTMTHEVLAYQAFHAMDVQGPNTGYAYLWVNGESYGLHLNLESLDDIALEKRFGPFEDPPQHLYEGEYAADVSESPWKGTSEKKWEKLEVDEGDDDDKADLLALLAAVEESSGSFSERVADHADLEQMTRMWMTERYTGHWDSYSGRASGEFWPNNYYLYSDADGVFQMLPWGTDQSWTERLEFFGPGGDLFEDCEDDDAGCVPLYLDAGEAALSELNALDLGTSARCTAASVLPWREFELDESDEERLPDYDLQETLDEQEEMAEFIAERPAELADFLEVEAPPEPTETLPCPPLRPIGGFPKPPPPDEPEEPGGGGSDEKQGGSGNPPSNQPQTSQPQSGQSQTSPPATVEQPAAATKPRLGKREIRADAIGLKLTTSVAGKLTLVGTFGGGEKPTIACRAHSTARTSAGGTANLSCRFTDRFKRRLELGPAFVRLTATLTTAAGDSQSRTKTLRIPGR